MTLKLSPKHPEAGGYKTKCDEVLKKMKNKKNSTEVKEKE